MLQKKICMLGATSVGKTSLVQRFVQSIYSEKYHATIGVKIDRKQVKVAGQEVMLLLWDVQGEDAEFKIRPAFLRGASGYLLIVDSTRRETLEIAESIQQEIEKSIGKIPFVLVLNKLDLIEQRAISDADLNVAGSQNFRWTSAKNGNGVEEAFQLLTEKILNS